MLGVQSARQRDGREWSQVNEERIAQATLAALQTELPAPQLAAALALGESLGYPDVCVLLADALAAPAS